MTDSYVIGNTIRNLREQKNMTQAELAGLIYVSPKTISKWETGKGLPDISLLELLAKVRAFRVKLRLQTKSYSGGMYGRENTQVDRMCSCFCCMF